MTATFHVGDAIQVMNTLPEKSVDLVLSSPPFLALRSYLPADHPDKALEGGSQATPGAYIDWLIDVVEACARVLAPHGSLCFELGDTYAGSGGAGGDYDETGLRGGQAHFDGSASGARRAARKGYGGAADRLDGTVKSQGTGWPLAKSLSLIPELFRYTLVYGTNPLTGRQTERWRLRNVIRWVRPNPPVGALGDKFRPATSELMVFCKSAKRFFDLDAVREPFSDVTTRQMQKPSVRGGRDNGPKSVGADASPHNYRERWVMTQSGAPPLDWWNIPPGGYEGAHYAVWPPELLIRPIKAMTPEKVCRECGEPSRRIVDRYRTIDGIRRDDLGAWNTAEQKQVSGRAAKDGIAHTRFASISDTLGFSDCGHNNYRPGLVLDPFVGSGTTLMVATGHGRDAIGIDLDERNYQLALERVGPLILQRGEVAA